MSHHTRRSAPGYNPTIVMMPILVANTILILALGAIVLGFILYVREIWQRVTNTGRRVADHIYSLIPRLTHPEYLRVSYGALAPPPVGSILTGSHQSLSRPMATFLCRTVVSAYNGSSGYDHDLPPGARIRGKIGVGERKVGYLYSFPSSEKDATIWVLAYRGTLEGEDLMADIDITQVPFSAPYVKGRSAARARRSNPMAHRGMLSVWQSTLEDLHRILRKVPPNAPFYVTGHSLGASLAAFTSIYVNSGAYDAQQRRGLLGSYQSSLPSSHSSDTHSDSDNEDKHIAPSPPRRPLSGQDTNHTVLLSLGPTREAIGASGNRLRVGLACLFGSPRVGNAAFVSLLAQWTPYWAIVNRCDQLPTLPPTVCGYYSGESYTYADYGGTWLFVRETESLIGNHTIDTYETALSDPEVNLYRLTPI